MIYVGIDIAKLNHFASIISSDGEVLIEPMRLHHKGLGNQKRVNAIRFCLANVVFSHGRRLDRINDTNMKMPGNEEYDKVIAVVSRCFKTNDEAV